jgi:PKD repeat protein
VDVNCTNAQPPYTNWAAAAVTIQDAIDIAAEGDTILVTNGVYMTGSRIALDPVGTNTPTRVVVDKAINVRSMNGPAFTLIEGRKARDGGNDAIRCAYLADGSVLSGFTLTNGGTNPEGCSGGVLCQSTNATLTNCIVTGNSAYFVGGIWKGTLFDCVITANTATYCGGAALSFLNRCEVSKNSANADMGGCGICTLNACTVRGNIARHGGGAFNSTLNNCTVFGNSAEVAGGVSGGVLNNCTITANSADLVGGAGNATLNNCILYNNEASFGSNHLQCVMNYCCTAPMPDTGSNNIATPPLLSDISHLSDASPCHGVGSASFTTGTDVDGEVWSDPPSIGCDEFHPEMASGPLQATILTDTTNVAPGFEVTLMAQTYGPTTATKWTFDDGSSASNKFMISHAWATPGDHWVSLSAFNSGQTDRVSTTLVFQVKDETHYVALNCINPRWPYASWETAATNIQDAIDAVAASGSLVLVSNGVYADGGCLAAGTLTSNRIVLRKPIILASVNGPETTCIAGQKATSGGNGSNAVRCVYLADGAALAGFTLTNGATCDDDSGGGVFCMSRKSRLTNCVLAGNSSSTGGAVCHGSLYECRVVDNHADHCGGAWHCYLSKCLLTGNSAENGGGGTDWSVLNECTLAGNSAQYGGGANYSTLYRCTLSGNFAQYRGGGGISCTMSNCILIGNSANTGAGAQGGVLMNCILTTNQAWSYGGGAGDSFLTNCAITGNTAFDGGGAYACNLNNCTLTGNTGISSGGGASGGALNNCIVYFNVASTGSNHSGSILNFCCTTPMPDSGTNNIASDPLMASTTHLSMDSPCRGAGARDSASGVDIDGQAWTNPPSIGCDELIPNMASGPLVPVIHSDRTNVVAKYPVFMTSFTTGRTTAIKWTYGDGITESNKAYTSHSWTVPGDYLVGLTAYNTEHPEGVSTSMVVHVVDGLHYVALNSANPQWPYTSWSTAATNIQDAVDAADLPTSCVLVSNGVYATGSRRVAGNRTASRVAAEIPIILASVNGPESTIIQGQYGSGDGTGPGAIRCVYLAEGAALLGFTLAGGASSSNDVGGGVYGQTLNVGVTNCMLIGNIAREGGGAYYATLDNCLLYSNSATYGGGAYGCVVMNNTVVGNTAAGGGGACSCKLSNSIVYHNTAQYYSNFQSCVFSYSCTMPMPAGTGNITNAPLFEDLDGGNLHLQSNSPCINAGQNASISSVTDLTGNPRIVCSTVDIGAYECQTPALSPFFSWLQKFNLATDATSIYADPDGDTMSNWLEWRYGTVPTNRLSAFLIASPVSDGTNVTITWQSRTGITYFVERAINLDDIPAFSLWATDIPGEPDTTSYSESFSPDSFPVMYRIGIQEFLDAETYPTPP